MADTINLAGNMPPEMMAEQQQLNRQQRMADLLTQQGMQGLPSGSMVSGHFVPTSPFQHLAQIANVAVGQYLGKKGDEEATKLAQKLRTQEISDIEKYQQMNAGTPAQIGGIQGPNGMTTQTTPDMYNADMSLNPQYRQVASVAAQAPNPQAANMFAASSYSPALRAMGLKRMTEGPKWEKAEYTDEKTGKTRQGVINVNSSDPISTFQVGGVKPDMTSYERATLGMRGAELADQGIGGYGAPRINMPTNVAPYSGQPQSQPVGQPSNLPVSNVQGQPKGTPVANFAPVAGLNQYQYDPMLSPKQNREEAQKVSTENTKNINNAKNSFGLLKSAAETLSSGAPSSGRLENMYTGANEFFGSATPASKADAIMTIYGTKLTQQVPRFEGPQSDKDTALYQSAAGDVGNANKPIETRLAAIQTMIDLNKKYYPNADWDSIKTELVNAESKVSLGPAPKPVAVPQASIPAPAGVDPAIWNVMTPQEKSLWQKR